MITPDDDAYITFQALEELLLNPLYGTMQASDKPTTWTDGSDGWYSQPKFSSATGRALWIEEFLEWQVNMAEDQTGWDYGSEPILYPQCVHGENWQLNEGQHGASQCEDIYDKKMVDGKAEIPITDVWVNVQYIKEAFSSSSTRDGTLNVIQVVRNLLKNINESTGYTNFQLIRVPTDDQKMMITDLNLHAGLSPFTPDNKNLQPSDIY